MIGYVTIGTNDIAKSAVFYDALLEALGAVRLMSTDTYIAWARDPQQAALCITTPWDGQPATVGNGVMVALQVKTRDEVDRMHALAIELGATDEGAPGQRGESFYAGYFRDPDGNKLNAFCLPGNA